MSSFAVQTREARQDLVFHFDLKLFVNVADRISSAGQTARNVYENYVTKSEILLRVRRACKEKT